MDDGIDQRRIFRLRCNIAGEVVDVDVPADQFAGLKWIDRQLGAGANLAAMKPPLGVLGNSLGMVVEVYAEADIQLAKRVMKEIG